MSAQTTHLRIQQEILQSLPEALLEKRFPEIGRIADVLWEEKKIVFEVQFSPIHPIEARERTRDYALIGYQVVWILHENMFNPLRPTPFQDFLKHFVHFYTNIDDLLGGEIYQIQINGLQIERKAVQLNKFDFKRSFHLRWPFMKKIYQFCTFAFLLFNSTQMDAVCNGTWISNNTLWNDPASWSNACFPTTPGDSANFADTGTNSVSLNGGSYSLGILNFAANALDFTIHSGGSLSLNNAPSSTSYLNVFNGLQTFDVPITLDSTTTMFTINSTLGFTSNSSMSGIGSSLIATGAASGVINNSSLIFNPGQLSLSLITFNNLGTISLLAPNAIFTITSGRFFNQGSFNFPAGGGFFELFGGTVINSSGSLADGLNVSLNMNNGILTNTNNATAFTNADSIGVSNSLIKNLSGSHFATNLAAASPIIIQTSSVKNGSSSYFGTGTSDINLIGSSFSNEGNVNAQTLLLTDSSFVNNGQVALTNILNLSNSSLNNNGTVIIANPFTIPNNSAVSGTGTFLGPTFVFNSGFLVPGNINLPGTLSFPNTNVTLENDGMLQIYVGNESAGQLAVETAEISGTLNVIALPDFFEGGVYTILSTTNELSPGKGYTGSFQTVNFLNFPPDFSYSLIYDPFEVLLGIGPTTLYGFFGNYYYMVFSSLNQVNYFLTKHMDWLNQHYFCELNPCGKQLCCPNPYQFNFYAGPIGSIGNIKSHGTQFGMTYNTEGFIAGCDYIMNCAAVGIEFDYERMNSRIRKNNGMLDNDHYTINVYGTYTPFDELALIGIIGGGGDQFKTKRPGFGRPILGSTGAGHFDALLGLQYTLSRRNIPFLKPEVLITPIASAQFMSLTVDGYNERNYANLQVRFEKQKYQSIRTDLGLLASWSFLINRMKFLPVVNFTWQHEFYDDQRDLHFRTSNRFADVSLEILPASRDVYLAGLDGVLELSDQFRLQGGYQFEGNSYYTNHFFTVAFDLSF